MKTLRFLYMWFACWWIVIAAAYKWDVLFPTRTWLIFAALSLLTVIAWADEWFSNLTEKIHP